MTTEFIKQLDDRFSEAAQALSKEVLNIPNASTQVAIGAELDHLSEIFGDLISYHEQIVKYLTNKTGENK